MIRISRRRVQVVPILQTASLYLEIKSEVSAHQLILSITLKASIQPFPIPFTLLIISNVIWMDRNDIYVVYFIMNFVLNKDTYIH